MKFLSISGFVVAIFGFVVGGFLVERELGATIFIAGFLIATTAMVGHIVIYKYPDEMKRAGLGIKAGAVGFGIGLAVTAIKRNN